MTRDFHRDLTRVVVMSRVAGVGSRGWFLLSGFGCSGAGAEAEAVISGLEDTQINSVAFDANGVRFVHVAHPSRGNGHFNAFVQGTGTAGSKRNLAKEALDTESL